MKTALVLSAIVCCFALTGCAQTTAIPIQPGDHRTPGIRIYDVKPLLMVYDEGANIEFIPNYNRGYALQFTAFLAKNDVKTTYEMGTLKTLDSNLDSTDFIKLLTTIANGFLNPGSGSPSTSSQPSGLGALRAVYDFEFDEFGDFVRLRRLDPGFPRPYPKPAIVPAPSEKRAEKDEPKIDPKAPKVGTRS